MPRLCVISRRAVPKLRRRVGENREDLRLHDDVERRRRLVGDQELRSQDERERDHDPLSHPAGELVRVLPEPRRRDPHPSERLERPRAHLSVGQLGLVLLEGLAEVILDPHQRVEARHRLLEDQAEVGAPQAPELLRRPCPRGSYRRRPPRRRRRHHRAAARGSHGQASTCRSPTRRRDPAPRPRRCRARRGRRP